MAALSEQGAKVTQAWPPSDRTEVLRGEEPLLNHQQPPQPSPAPGSERKFLSLHPALSPPRCHVADQLCRRPGPSGSAGQTGLWRAWASQPHLHPRESRPKERGRRMQSLSLLQNGALTLTAVQEVCVLPGPAEGTRGAGGRGKGPPRSQTCLQQPLPLPRSTTTSPSGGAQSGLRGQDRSLLTEARSLRG